MDYAHQLHNYKPTPYMAPGYFYKERFADGAVGFINMLKHTKAPWQGMPFELLAWQEQLIRDVFGIVRRKDELRQFKEIYLELPKKNGKSALAAAVALLLLCADGEYGGGVYGCAVDRQQAGIVFDVALNMIDQCGPLKKRTTFSSAKKQIFFKPLRSTYQAVSAEYGNKDGFNAHGVIFDELHAQKSSELYDVMTSSSGLSRQQQLIFIITTAGLDRESICWKHHCLAREIIDGARPPIPSFYPVIYGIKEGEDWHDEAVWRRVNPSYGISVIEDNFRMEYEKALIDPVAENAFRRLNLNEWVSPY